MNEMILDTTVENGIVEDVHIAPIGDFVGSDAQGNPVPEKLTVEALSALADKMNADDDVLCDVDHQSCRPGVEKDTSAAGWFTNFIVDPIKGLFAKLKLTKRGKELLENREYRYTSPSFLLDKDGMPVDMHSISLTNTPAFKGYINPIINSEATQVDVTNESITDMTKDELVNLIKETVTAMNSEPVKEEVKEETKEEAKEETQIENSCDTDKKDEAENTCATDEKTVEDKKDVVNEVEKTEVKYETNTKVVEEVIKEEALNSAPVIGVDITGKNEWENLKGDAFWAWLKKHPQGR